MKSKAVKIIFISIFLFLFVPNVSARFNGCFDINEKSYSTWSTNWDAKLKICDMEKAQKVGMANAAERTSYSAAIDAKKEWVYVTRESIDAKSTDTIAVKRCDREDARIDFKSSCTYKITTYKCHGKDKYGNGINCYDETETYDGEVKVEDVKGNQNANALCQEQFNADAGSCSCKDSQYILMCPVYNCPPTYKVLSTCTPTFEVNGDAAHCVNPSESFNSSYQEADFYADSCTSSNSTVDCGFANILIEAAWNTQKNNHYISEQQIQLALRLWGVHSGRSGYEKVGLANVVGENCGEYVTFIIDEEKNEVNVYRATLDYIFSHLLEHARDIAQKNDDYLDVSKANSYFSEITCSRYGVSCGYDNDYREAIALFLNTYFGNKKMQEHLNELVGLSANTKPVSVSVETEEESRIEIEFDKRISTPSDKKYNCELIEQDKTLPKDKLNYPELDEEQRDYILNYCDVEVSSLYLVKPDGTKEPILDEEALKNLDKYVEKGIIVVEKFKQAVCQVDNGVNYHHYEITIQYKKTTRTTEVKKYIACSAPDQNQILYSFGKDINPSETVEHPSTHEETDTTTFDVNINCKGGCTDYSVRESEAKCDSQKEYDNYYTGYVKDPSLSCIVNMPSRENQAYYDYSDYFKVNTDICRVYCSDEVDYYIAGKVNISSGLSFKYDIKPGEVFDKTNQNKLSSIIEEKRRCVSEIYYDNEFKETNTQLIEKYGITDEDLSILPDKKISNWQNLFIVLFNKSLKEGYRTENLNQIIYDLYNCNFVTNIPSTINKPKENTIGNLYDYVKKLYGDKNHGLVINNGDINSVWLNNITYTGGAEYINGSSSVGNSSSDIDVINSYSENNISKVTYCSGYSYNCLEYDSKNEKYTYDDTFGEFKTGSLGVSITKEDKKNSVSLNKLKKIITTKVPTNDYALFEITTQMNYYNGSKFETEAYTGKVNKIKDKETEEYITLDDYIYPMSKNAYNNTKCQKNGNIVSCPITQKFSSIATYYRNKSSDAFTNKLKSTKFTEFNCKIDVNIPQVTIDDKNSKSIYRNVNLNDLFPNNSLASNSNWYGVSAKDEIEASAESINGSSDYYLEYKIVLTPEVIKNIKLYNKTIPTGYLNNTLSECTITDNKIFLNCKSSFLNGIRGGSQSFGIDTSLGKLDGVSKYTESKEKTN